MDNIRKQFIDREKTALKNCIRKKKVLDVLTVVYNEDDQTFEIIKGQRRFLAACALRDEGFQIPKLPCMVKAQSSVESTEESLLDELMRVGVEQTDTGKAVLKLIKYYGDTNKVAMELGVKPDWLSYYVQTLNQNEPAQVIEIEKKEKVSTSITDFAEEEEEIKSGKTTLPINPFASLSLDEQKEAQRRQKADPTKSTIIIKSEVKDWIDNTYEIVFRLESSLRRACVEYAKDNKIPLRRLLDIEINNCLKKKMKERKYL